MHCFSFIRRPPARAVIAAVVLLAASVGPSAAWAANLAPSISGTPSSWVYVGSQYSFRPSASDPERRTLKFSIANKPAWASFSTYNGRLSGTPSAVGLWQGIEIKVSDGVNVKALPKFSLRATSKSNVAPTISGSPATTATVGVAYSFQPTAKDANGDPLILSISNKPGWASFSSSTGALSGTPAASGTFSSITISVTDGAKTVSLPAFTLTVKAAAPANTAPTISGSPATSVIAGSAYSFQPSASDANGDALAFSIANMPAWATFSTSTGRLSGTPATTHAGTYANVLIAVSDGKVSTALSAFTISVTAPANRAPTISGSPATSATAGQSYSFQPSANDADGDTLGFSITGRPTWATFSTTTGRLSGTPTTAQAGFYASIAISVSDGKVSSALPVFGINVAETLNAAPKISGSPATSVQAGVAYSFLPTGSDADGDTLTFSIANRPAWATFNTGTGQLSGTPTSAQVAAYANIVISVSDGKTSASLPAFAIAVTGNSTGAATLSWTPPTQNTDGSACTNLAGYRIHYGVSATALTQSIQVANPGLSSYVVENLSPGTYYFAVSAYTNTDAESENSNVGTKVVQ